MRIKDLIGARAVVEVEDVEERDGDVQIKLRIVQHSIETDIRTRSLLVDYVDGSWVYSQPSRTDARGYAWDSADGDVESAANARDGGAVSSGIAF